MATKIAYTEDQKKKLKDCSWNGRGKGTAAARAVKMVRPICDTCQKGLDTLVGWYDTCEHDPYWSLSPKVIKTPIYETDEDGDMVLKETESRTKMIRMPNITEVVLQETTNDGRGVEFARERKGFKYMQEVGLAPMCELYGCGRAWPTVGTEMGDYCNEMHAKLSIANATGVKFTVYVDPNVPGSANLIRRELQEVVI